MFSALNRLALCALVGAVPVTVIDEVLRTAGVAAERVRTLPPWVTTYHVLGSALSPLAGYDDVTDLLWATLPAATGRGLSRQRPTRGAVTRARSRLGTHPLALLLRATVRAASAGSPPTAVHLHRFGSPGMPGLWWIADPDTGGLRGCDAGGTGLDTAVALVRSAPGVAHVTVGLPAQESAALQQRLGPDVLVVSGALPAVDEALWSGLRARTRVAWEQEALARACVSVALEKALTLAREAGTRR
nr:transposase domain-containing protein [Mycobacterium sp. NAZ190054]